MSANGDLRNPFVRMRAPESPHLSPRVAAWLRWANVRVDFTDPRVAELERAKQEADPLADALVAWMEGLPKGVGYGIFSQALERGIASLTEAPEPLLKFFAQLERVPAWLDRAQIARGTRVMQRHGLDSMSALSVVLMSGYLTCSATKPLVLTGALTKDAPRRLESTARFVRDVMMSDDMSRYSAGFRTTVRVRIMHAQVRSSLRGSPEWDKSAWGTPLHQRDMVATHLLFTVAYLGAALAVGRIDTRKERDDVMHLWRYVSHLLGLRDELLPTSFADGLQLLAYFNCTEEGPDEDGVALAKALMAAWRQGPPTAPWLGRWVEKLLVGHCRYFMGSEAASSLGIPDTPWKYVPPGLAVLALPFELLQLLHPELRAWAVRRGRAQIAQRFSVPLPASQRSSEQGVPQLLEIR